MLWICCLSILASTAFARHPEPEPSYAKWGNMAVQETMKRYGFPIIDYLHVGRTYISARKAEEKFKLWLRKPDGKEFGVYVTIRFDPVTDRVETIGFEETNR
ncbi:DUF3889 domain-containing protein [Cohnella pontilimi]|uniref:DUF3889 domain-containing protein n=2 Tax=Cohnella pontilimi TaxID=2564100 RepID=A0A4U0FAB4_9BACL|nr:DUF3889 domain-containing protein [Cohnella pontilimi]